MDELNKDKKREYFSIRPGRIIKLLLITLFLALFLKFFFVEAYKIPTSSMEETLMEGDFIIVNKAAYSVSIPHSIPLFNIKLPDFDFISYSKPSRGDVIVFEFPDHWDGKQIKTVNYVKRIIGEPGDVVEIADNVVYVNGRKLTGFDLENHKTLDSKVDEKIFHQGGLWNGKDFGPVIVPWKGLSVELNSKNINKIAPLIDREFKDRVISVAGSVIRINGKPVHTYTFKEDHFFVMGDNRDDSMDSRHWGFIPANLIIGKAALIYWSLDPSVTASGIGHFFSAIRFNRIFSMVN
jgi:signal peptidase I